MADDLEGAVEDHQQRHVEREEKCEFVPGQVSSGGRVHHEAFAVGCVDVMQKEDMAGHCNGDQPQHQSAQHGLAHAQGVNGMVGMHHTHVPVQGDDHQEESAPAAVHRQHEEADVTDRLTENPADPRQVVAGSEGQSHDEHEVSHCQVEE